MGLAEPCWPGLRWHHWAWGVVRETARGGKGAAGGEEEEQQVWDEADPESSEPTGPAVAGKWIRTTRTRKFWSLRFRFFWK